MAVWPQISCSRSCSAGEVKCGAGTTPRHTSYLDWKADMSVRDAAGNTALHLATQTGNPRGIVAFLLRRCDDPIFKLVNEFGRSALHYATSSVEVAELPPYAPLSTDPGRSGSHFQTSGGAILIQ